MHPCSKLNKNLTKMSKGTALDSLDWPSMHLTALTLLRYSASWYNY